MERLTGKQAQSMMEAFASVYEKKVEPTETEQVDEGVMGAVKKFGDVVKKVGTAVIGPANQSKEAEEARTYKRRPQTPQQQGVANKTAEVMKNSADLFDIVKGHLIDEGLTEEEALKKMLTLTDDERSEIIEGSCDSKNKKKMKKGGY